MVSEREILRESCFNFLLLYSHSSSVSVLYSSCIALQLCFLFTPPTVCYLLLLHCPSCVNAWGVRIHVNSFTFLVTCCCHVHAHDRTLDKAHAYAMLCHGWYAVFDGFFSFLKRCDPVYPWLPPGLNGVEGKKT